MATLGNPTETISIIQKYGFHFQKKYGQNFLIDSHILEKIIYGANITKEDCVLEIGPGIGTMTQYLCENAGRVIAVEIDRNLISILKDTLSIYQNKIIIHADILKLDLEKLVKTYNNKSMKVVANLPYYITTPIVMKILESKIPFESITVMMQKEVADRIQASPGTKEYGAISLAVQYFAKPEIVAIVPPNCFMPRPKVHSCVLRLTKHIIPPVMVKDEKKLFALIRAGFNQRRKTLQNALCNAEGLSFTKKEIIRAMEELQWDIRIRGEALTLKEFAALSDRLGE